MMHGLCAAGFLGRNTFRAVLDQCQVNEAIRLRYCTDSVQGVLVGVLAYGEGVFPMPDWATIWTEEHPGPKARLARFVRANWYAQTAAILKIIAHDIINGLPAEHPGKICGFKKNWHFLVNSQLPEKPLTIAAGLGFIGRNSLVIVTRRGIHLAGDGPVPGPGVVLGLMLMPVDPETAGDALLKSTGIECDPAVFDQAGGIQLAAMPGGLCGSCMACVDACPTNAISPQGGIRRELCLQHWAAIPGELPASIRNGWGDRLYGCDSCLEACPWFQQETSPIPSLIDECGLLGPLLPAGFFIGSEDETIRTRLSNTALGLGWMDPRSFRRNAQIAAEELHVAE